MKFKLNWGHKLLILTITFMLFIIACVTFMIKQNVELVESDYYEKGIKYQTVIDQSKESYKLIAMEIDSSNGKALSIAVLDSSIKTLTGDLFFYRPSDKSKDFTTAVSISFGQAFQFPLSTFDKGVWKVTLIWEDTKGKHQLMKNLML